MIVPAINSQNNKPYFGLKVSVKTENMQKFMQYLQNHTDTPKRWYNSRVDLELMNKILFAFEQHPSEEELVPDIKYLRGVLFNARGTIKSSKAKFTDPEPARSDSGKAAIFNILRRILDPENKKQFNKLVGNEYAPYYETWWEKYIAPIWTDINENFREPVLHRKNFDKKYNAEFNRQSGSSKWAWLVNLYKRLFHKTQK